MDFVRVGYFIPGTRLVYIYIYERVRKGWTGKGEGGGREAGERGREGGRDDKDEDRGEKGNKVRVVNRKKICTKYNNKYY